MKTDQDIHVSSFGVLPFVTKWAFWLEPVHEYSTFSSESFRDDVSIQNWNYSHDNVHDSFIDFYTKLEGPVNRHAHLKKLSPKEIKVKNKPWLNADIFKMIKVRNKVFARK